MKKRFIALIICGCMLLGAIVSASGSAGQNVTLISRSYLEGTFRQELILMISEGILSATRTTYTTALESLNSLGQSYLDKLKPDDVSEVDWLTAADFVIQGGEKDDTITLAVGAGFVLTSGSAEFSGTLIDLTSGTEVQSGTITVGHRYVAADQCLITIHSDTAYWSVEGEWLTTSDGIRVVFSDVPKGEWYYDPVYYVVDRGLFVGTSDTTFSPRVTMNRGMLATVLHRMAGEPEVTYSPIFSDVAESAWYAPGVVWAAENNILATVEGDTCQPQEDLTRQEIVVMLYNYANWVGIDTSARADLSTAPDGNMVPDWAREAMSWAVATGIIIGDTNGKLTPEVYTNRAQVATVLLRFDELFIE